MPTDEGPSHSITQFCRSAKTEAQLSINRWLDFSSARWAACQQLGEQETNSASIVCMPCGAELAPGEFLIRNGHALIPYHTPVFKVIEITRQGKIVDTYEALTVSQQRCRCKITMTNLA